MFSIALKNIEKRKWCFCDKQIYFINLLIKLHYMYLIFLFMNKELPQKIPSWELNKNSQHVMLDYMSVYDIGYQPEWAFC